MSHAIQRAIFCFLTLFVYAMPGCMLAMPTLEDFQEGVDYDQPVATGHQATSDEQYYDAEQFQPSTRAASEHTSQHLARKTDHLPAPQSHDSANSSLAPSGQDWSAGNAQPTHRTATEMPLSASHSDHIEDQVRHAAVSPQANMASQSQAAHSADNAHTDATNPAIAHNLSTAQAQSQHPQLPSRSVSDGKHQNQDLSPWEQFLIYTISILHFAQSGIEHYFSILLSKQGIPLLIITFGVLLLNIVIWFAYVSFKKEQSVKIKNLMRNKTSQKPLADAPEPLALAYAEESSGDFDVFATSEGIPIKLDLAQAYLNMGEVDGAKEILIDIISQHRGKIVSAAQAMLKKIDDR